jgi:membrane-bound metal-dependent hydrolase YbcI (DUF457 family)
MFVGHYGVSFGAKKLEPSIPLWVLFIAVQWLDVVWAPLVLLGIEKVRIVPGFTATNPLDLYYMPYTHSLVAALLWSVAAFLVYRIAAQQRASSASIVAGAVFSHWILDLIVHRPDLPLYDNTAKVGLGLWNFAPAAFAVEALIFFGGMFLYVRAGIARSLAIVIFGFIMLAIHAFTFFGSPPGSDRAAAFAALAMYALFAFVIRLLERSATMT